MLLCNKCNKENKSYNEFCEFCGFRLRQEATTTLIFLRTTKKALRIIRRHKVVGALFSVILLAGFITSYLPKVMGGVEANKIITSVSRFERVGDYDKALSTLAIVDSNQLTSSKREEIEKLKKDESRYLKYQEYFEEAVKKSKEGKKDVALEILALIETDFPEYKKVKEMIDELNLVVKK